QYGIDIPKAKLALDEPIKTFGTFEVKAKLPGEVSAVVVVQVFEAK
ncbi:MAG: 50S ribosomal protein L9, partial [Clostridia bacterium]|nr:50S ribosomal protein L9 [Clostridia bacterium]